MLQRFSVRFLAALALTVLATAGLAAAGSSPATDVAADSQWGPTPPPAPAPVAPVTLAGADDSQWG
ncbi:hypothetical protein [Streptomyces vietnamensis]|uniref:Uncharacterized protein n=1 Tax=Streptomyces vietnamensis TaxID=362257 RepID=A0A0B5IBH1_9ACTN|nr:hypothetical protein [Streptomyces vietnamensis]AJF67782.1 hypothetical protein SVTN_28765 [Streptomyces vietnamensis]